MLLRKTWEDCCSENQLLQPEPLLPVLLQAAAAAAGYAAAVAVSFGAVLAAAGAAALKTVVTIVVAGAVLHSFSQLLSQLLLSPTCYC